MKMKYNVHIDSSVEVEAENALEAVTMVEEILGGVEHVALHDEILANAEVATVLEVEEDED